MGVTANLAPAREAARKFAWIGAWWRNRRYFTIREAWDWFR